MTGSSKKYTGKDVGGLFHQIGQPELETAWHHNVQSTSLAAPGVETYVIAGSGFGTPQAYEFAPTRDGRGLPDMTQPPRPHCVDGDGVATMDSLIGVPTRWQAQGTQRGKPVHLVTLPKMGHGNTVGAPEATDLLYEILMK